MSLTTTVNGDNLMACSPWVTRHVQSTYGTYTGFLIRSRDFIGAPKTSTPSTYLSPKGPSTYPPAPPGHHLRSLFLVSPLCLLHLLHHVGHSTILSPAPLNRRPRPRRRTTAPGAGCCARCKHQRRHRRRNHGIVSLGCRFLLHHS
jgi:hypothetical protein